MACSCSVVALPEIGKYLGKGLVEFKKGLKGLEDDLDVSHAPRTDINTNQLDAPRPPQRVTTTAPKFEDNAEAVRTPDAAEAMIQFSFQTRSTLDGAALNLFSGSCVRESSGAMVCLRFAGSLTQRLECYPHTVEVTGSNPVAPTLKALFAKIFRLGAIGIAWLDNSRHVH